MSLTLKCKLACLAIGIVIHTLIAYYTYHYTKNVLQFTNSVTDENGYPDLMMEVILNILYYVVIDATFVIFTVNRSGVRVWHWKISTVMLVSLLTYYFSSNLLLHGSICLILFIGAYYRLTKEKMVVKVGLSKYVKGNADYGDISFMRNIRYVLLTFAEFFLIYHHKMCFLSPLIFVIIDAVVNRITGFKRTKLSDVYVSTFTAAMDTGLWMAVLAFKSRSDLGRDLLSLMLYIVLIRCLVFVNQNELLQNCYEIGINHRWRYLSLFLWCVFTHFIGESKHAFAIFILNITANMFIFYLSADIVYKFGSHTGLLYFIYYISSKFASYF